MTYVPGRGPCYRCLFPEPPADGLVPNCAEAGVLGVLPGVMGTLQATEAIKLIVGIGAPLIGRLLTYDALAMKFEEFRFKRRPECAVCGDRPSIKEPRDFEELCSAETLAGIQQLAPRALQALLARESGVALVDVREPKEFEVAHLPGAVNIPAGQLQQRIGELPSSATMVFICRSGVRSLNAAAIANRAGLAGIAHLEGGLLAWTREVDDSFEVAPVG